MPGSITSFSRLLNELLDTRREARWVEKGNRNAFFPVPPFGKGGYGGISEAVENPPKQPVRQRHSEASAEESVKCKCLNP